jgi:signal transduction histidine kinase
MRVPLPAIALRFDHDLVTARRYARSIAGQVGFDAQDQSRIATAVSELARNALRYARGGWIRFAVDGAGDMTQRLEIEVGDSGRGIPHLHDILAGGAYRSTTGMGIGLIGTRRLMDRFSIESGSGGTIVRIAKQLPPRARLVTAADGHRIISELQHEEYSPIAEVEQQNRELMRALGELKRRQEELTQLNRELEDTNRGVLALYAELDEKAGHLRRADELKSKLLSNLSHEFRTPVSAILAISRILLDRLDGGLTTEQERQVSLIRHAAETLSDLVTDWLDSARVDAGKSVIRPVSFNLAELFAALRGMLRPLLLDQSVSLVFEDPDGLPTIYGDEGKISQIVRNFISNALKFTERGEVRVRAVAADGGRRVRISVADTGIGIAPEHIETIFDEFSQIDHPVQRKVRGTGLGLSLSRKLATLLGGRICVESTLGVGSTFTLEVPVTCERTPASSLQPPAAAEVAIEDNPADRQPLVLVVEDHDAWRETLGTMLRGMHYRVVLTGSGGEALASLDQHAPDFACVDLGLPDIEGIRLIDELRARGIPPRRVLVVTAGEVAEAVRRRLEHDGVPIVSKIALGRSENAGPLRDAVASLRDSSGTHA